MKRNPISGTREPFPRLMWADCDAADKRTPVAIYTTKSEQRSNRPDLKPIRVVVIALEGSAADMQTHLANAISTAKERGAKRA